jgi:hypothetical protein
MAVQVGVEVFFHKLILGRVLADPCPKVELVAAPTALRLGRLLSLPDNGRMNLTANFAEPQPWH